MIRPPYAFYRMSGVTETQKTSKLKFGIKAEMVKSHVFTGHEGIPFFNEKFNLQHKINFVIQIVFTFG